MSPPTWRERWRQIFGGREAHDERVRVVHRIDDGPYLDEGPFLPDGPPEHDGGQDDEPPDLFLAILATLALLSDIRDRLDREDDPRSRDLMLRIRAVSRVLSQLRELEEDA